MNKKVGLRYDKKYENSDNPFLCVACCDYKSCNNSMVYPACFKEGFVNKIYVVWWELLDKLNLEPCNIMRDEVDGYYNHR